MEVSIVASVGGGFSAKAKTESSRGVEVISVGGNAGFCIIDTSSAGGWTCGLIPATEWCEAFSTVNTG
jgi:hypothetical protein